jgi:hypothetical protein
MTDQRSESGDGPSGRPDSDPGKVPSKTTRSPGYVEHVREVLTDPDRFFDSRHRSGRGEALIDLAGFALVYFLAAVVARTFGFYGFEFDFGHLVDGFKSILVLALPLAGLVFAWAWQGGRNGAQAAPGFYLEKLGGALLLPALLLAVAIVLDVFGARIHVWFRGAAMTFVSIGVFAMTYAYAAPGKLRAAAVFTFGFYIVYRLLVLLF